MKVGDLLMDEKTGYGVLLTERRAYSGTWYWYTVSTADGTGTWAPDETLKRLFTFICSSKRGKKK